MTLFQSNSGRFTLEHSFLEVGIGINIYTVVCNILEITIGGFHFYIVGKPYE